MAKSKKSAFSRFSKQQLIIGGVFILGFGGFGIWKVAFSDAASNPPSKFTQIKGIKPANLPLYITCLSTASRTGYGALSFNCYYNTGGQITFGSYSLPNKTFSKTAGPYTTGTIYSNQGGYAVCTNLGSTPFYPTASALTGYGELRYGYTFVYSGSVWKAKPAIYSEASNRSCSVDRNWENIQAW